MKKQIEYNWFSDHTNPPSSAYHSAGHQQHFSPHHHQGDLQHPATFNFLPQKQVFGSGHVLVTSHDEALIAAQDYR